MIEEARELLESGHEPKAVELLNAALDASDDPELLAEIHELAVDAHERAEGFQKMEWHKLVVRSEPRPAAHVGG